MKKQPEPVTRDHILKILSDDEVARVGMTETAAQLVDGDEFIDLTELGRGVQRAGESHPMVDVLSRKAVHENTWRKVVTNMTARQLMTHVPSVPWKRTPT
jgi:glycine cleavage system H lipoate-binding protein